MVDLGKMLILLAVVIGAVGVVVLLLGKSGFRGLPGDVAYEGRNVRFYFPVVTCIVLSILLTAGMWLWRWLSGR